MARTRPRAALHEGRRSNGQKDGADRDAQPARISAREIAGGGSGAAGPGLLPIAPPPAASRSLVDHHGWTTDGNEGAPLGLHV
jgi:hypothetical protein